MKTNFYVLIFSICVIGCCGAQDISKVTDGISEIKPSEDYHTILQAFFLTIRKGKTDDAFSGLIATNPTFRMDAGRVIQESGKFTASVVDLGRFSCFDVQQDRLLTPHIACVDGFAIFDKQPYLMEFIFIRPDGKWIFNDFHYSQDVSSLIKSEAKLLKEDVAGPKVFPVNDNPPTK